MSASSKMPSFWEDGNGKGECEEDVDDIPKNAAVPRWLEAELVQREKQRRLKREKRGLLQLDDALRTETAPGPLSSRAYAAALNRMFRFWSRPLLKYLQAEIAREVSLLAERYRAMQCRLYVVKGDQLQNVQVNGFTGGLGRVLQINGPGIVAMVARTMLPYRLGDVDGTDPYYIPFGDEIRSEQAVPIVDSNGRLLGVLDQESPFPGTFSAATARALEQDATKLVGPLLASKALDAGCLWNPDRHGWDITKFFDMTISDIRLSLGRAGERIHLTIWYADPQDRTVFALATTGYSGRFLRTRTLDIESSFAGELAALADDSVRECSVGDPRMARPDLDEAMGLTHARAVTIRSFRDSQGELRSGLVLSIYEFLGSPDHDDQTPSALPDEKQLREISQMLREQAEAYITLRPALAEAYVRQVIQSCPDSGDVLVEVGKAVERVLGADAVTILARPRKTNTLHVVAATTPLETPAAAGPVPMPPPRELGRFPSGYTVDDGSFTGTLASRPGTGVRQNTPTSLADVAKEWPAEISLRLRERLPRAVSPFRRFLGYAVSGQSHRKAMAVFRVIRSADALPFTVCDLDVLRTMAQACIEEFQSWRDWHAHAVRQQDLLTPRYRSLLPLPRSSGRPARAIAREVLADLSESLVVRFGPAVLQTALLVEQPGGAKHPMQVFSYYTRKWLDQPDAEFDSTAPNPGPGLSPLVERIGTSWPGLFDQEAVLTFEKSDDERSMGEVRQADQHSRPPYYRQLLAGARVPIWAWIGRHVQRAVLIVDLDQPVGFDDGVVDDLYVAACKLSAILTTSGSSANCSDVAFADDQKQFVEKVRKRLKATAVRLELPPIDGHKIVLPWDAGTSPAEFDRDCNDPDYQWTLPLIESPQHDGLSLDRDGILWGVQECRTKDSDMLRVPIRLGMIQVGEILACWDANPSNEDKALTDAIRRAIRVRDILSCWSTWSWRPSTHRPFWTKMDIDSGPGGIIRWKPTFHLKPLTATIPPPNAVAMNDR